MRGNDKKCASLIVALGMLVTGSTNALADVNDDVAADNLFSTFSKYLMFADNEPVTENRNHLVLDSQNDGSPLFGRRSVPKPVPASSNHANFKPSINEVNSGDDAFTPRASRD